MIFLTVILSLTLIVLGYVCFNLFRKVEKLESVVDSQNQFISRFGQAIGYADERLAAIDEKGAFQSDDEIGWFFESVKTLQRELNDFNLLSPVVSNDGEPVPPPIQKIKESHDPIFETSLKLDARN